jgi:hypothetical protein
LIYSALGDKAYSREMIEIFFDGQTIVSRDFRVSELHKSGKQTTFKTSGQEMGYMQELERFIASVRGNEAITSSLSQELATMGVIFGIERALATASIQNMHG